MRTNNDDVYCIGDFCSAVIVTYSHILVMQEHVDKDFVHFELSIISVDFNNVVNSSGFKLTSLRARILSG